MNKNTNVLASATGRAHRRALRTRKRLMDAALALFSEKGVDATTIENITEKADLGKGTFYRYYKSKDAAMVALIEEAEQRLTERIHTDKARFHSVADVLEHLIEAHSKYFLENNNEFLLLFQGRLFLKLQRDSAGGLEQPYLMYLQEIEQQLIPFVPQPISPMKVRRLACAVAGFVSGFFSFAMIGMTTKDIETSIEPLRRAFVASATVFLGK